MATLANPRPVWGAYFGLSVAISGTQVVVGAPDFDARDSNEDFAYVYDLGGPTPTMSQFTLNSPSPASMHRFGSSVAISGPRAVIGATGAGRVHVYDFSSVTPTSPVTTLTNTNLAGGGFGSSVAISGTRVIVGASEENSYAGSTYVYDLLSVTPAAPVLTLTKPNPMPGDRFGASAAISGALVVVGAFFDDTGAVNAGAAYVYDLASVAPTVPVITLTNPSPGVDHFAYSVAISSTRVVVGAPEDDTGAPNAGSAYVYDIASTTPTAPVATLTNHSPASNDYFGFSVAISGARVVVGAPQDDTGATDSGSAYVYDLDSATPAMPVAILNNPDPASADRFGWMVAISGDYVVVSVPLDATKMIGAGSAYVYDLASTTPTVPVATLNNPRPGFNNYFGFSVAIDGATIVVGTPGDDTTAADRGAAHVFGLRPALSILPAASGLATLSWMPTTSSGFVLQYVDSLAPTNWLNVPSGEANPVTISSTNAARFYRLFQP